MSQTPSPPPPTSTQEPLAESPPPNPSSPPRPPSGTVTFLFTDIEGSTKRWEKHPQEMAVAVARHDQIMREAIAAHHGHVFKTVGDAFCAAFPTAVDAATAALAAQKALAEERWDDAVGPIRVRMGLHTGESEERDNDYFGPPVNRVARLMSAGHGGQVLVSDVTDDHVRQQMPEGAQLRSLGRHRLKDLARPEQIYQLVGLGLPAEFPRIKTQPSPYSGLTAAAVATLLLLVSFRFGTRSSSEGVSLALLSPLSLFTGLKGLILELSTLHELILLGVGGLFLLIAVAIGVARWRAVRRERALKPGERRRVAVAVVNQRTVAFFGALALTVLGAYAYQQYLWNVALPVPDGALGIALTREAAAATLTDELADALYSQGQAEQVVVRQLPVRFDARDTAKARAMGERIGARAVIIYRVDEAAAAGQSRYVAYVVFTDPGIGLTIGGSPDAANGATTGDQSAVAPGQLQVQVKEGVPVPVLRTESLEELVNAAAGIIAYDDDRAREAIGHLELARPNAADAPNTGIVNFYLGNAYNLDSQTDQAAAAYERAAAFYQGRQQAGEILGPQDGLILVKSYLERGRIASYSEDWKGALAWYERALGPREDVLARADGLERPADVHATYASLYTLMADAYRFLSRAEDQRVWEERARDELAALAERSDPDDPTALNQQSTANFFIGDCNTAGSVLDRAIALDPDDTGPLADAGIVALSQGRPDLARDYWRQIIERQPDDIKARELVAITYILQGIGEKAFEPAYLLEAEALYREIIALDPTNVAARENLADLAALRAGANEIDTTALSTDDALSVAKSQVLWKTDPAHRQAALDAYAVVIDERRILASELQRGNAGAQVAVAVAYLSRVKLLYGHLLALSVAGNTAQVSADSPAMGKQILADAVQIREWTDRTLANPNASRLDTLTAWSARVESLDREWSWYFFFANDTAKATALEAEFRQAVKDAVAFGEAEPIAGLDEIAPLRMIYFEAQAVAQMLDQDQAAADAQWAKIEALTAREQEERSAGITHYTTFCTAERETAAGDALLAKGDAAGAQPHYEAALEANPAHVAARRNLADARAQQGDIPSAVAHAQEATEAAPARADLWGGLARYQLAAGDAAFRASLDRFLALAAELPPQERMATLASIIADLDTLATEQPTRTPMIRETVPLLGDVLDGMAPDGKDSYQYPALYAALGRLALDLDDAPRAEPLLRRTVELDSHQPASHADLVMAVLVQGRDATAEMEAAFAEAADPVWSRITDYGWERVLTLMEEEAARFAARLPARAAAVAPFTEALPAARERVDWQRRGVVGTTYTSPTQGFGIRWDASWSVTDAAAENGTDSLEIGNGTSSVLLQSYSSGATEATGCRDEFVELLTTSDAWQNMALAKDANGREHLVGDAERASAALIERPEGEPPSVYVLECRALADGAGFVMTLAIVPVNVYAQQAEPVNRLLAAFHLGAADTSVGDSATPVAATPVATSVEPLTLPALDLSAVLPKLPGVADGSYTSPSVGFSLPVRLPWAVENATSEEGNDVLQVTDGSSRVYLDAYREDGVTPTSCLDEAETEFREDTIFADMTAVASADSKPMQGSQGGEATAVFPYAQPGEDGAPDMPQVLYVACRFLTDGAMLRVVHVADQEEYDGQATTRDALLAGLVLKEAPAVINPRPTEPPRR